MKSRHLHCEFPGGLVKLFPESIQDSDSLLLKQLWDSLQVMSSPDVNLSQADKPAGQMRHYLSLYLKNLWASPPALLL